MNIEELKNQLKNSINEISVYDFNSYTSIELYYKIANKVNEIIKELKRHEILVSDEIIKQNNALQEMLDVGLHDEVINKINDMVNDGTMDSIINQNVLKELNSQIKDKANQIDLEVERKRIDSFTKLAEGSTTGDAELIDGRIGADGITYNNLGTAIRTQFSKLNDKFYQKNLLNKGTLVNSAICNQNGVIIENSSFSNYSLVKWIPVSANVTLKTNFNARFIVLFDENKSFVNSSGDSQNDADLEFTPSIDGYLCITLYNTNLQKFKCFISSEDAKYVEPLNNYHLNQNVKIIDNGVNDIVDEKIQSDICSTDNLLSTAEFYENTICNTALHKTASTKYSYFKLPITKGVEYNTTMRSRFLVITDTSNNKQSNSYPDEVFDATNFTALVDGYAYITVYNDDLDEVAVYETGKSDNLTKLGKRILKDDITINVSNVIGYKDGGNILNGKKWVACGDSFTAGGYNSKDGIDETLYKYQDGLYKGKQITYPYIIGLRNNMTIVNEAVSGSTMTVNSNASAGNFANTRYKNIPTDADYITLYFGINDDNYSSTLGTIDDTDTTTFYGAWNTVMEYIITNHPYAKIGIIITNGSAPKYTEAERNIAKKWGIPYLDLEKDYNVPLMHRATERSELCEKVKQLRMNSFRISSTNTHPNVRAHEYESTFIENWLRSL